MSLVESSVGLMMSLKLVNAPDLVRISKLALKFLSRCYSESI